MSAALPVEQRPEKMEREKSLDALYWVVDGAVHHGNHSVRRSSYTDTPHVSPDFIPLFNQQSDGVSGRHVGRIRSTRSFADGVIYRLRPDGFPELVKVASALIGTE